MRDTLVLIGIIALIIVVLLWKKPGVGPSEITLKQGAQNEILATPFGGKSRHVRKERSGKVGRFEKMVEQSEELPSIYSSSKRAKLARKKKKKYLHGLPVESFVDSRMNTLPSGVPDQAPEGVRVFLQCMELRPNDTAKLTESECNALASRTSTRNKFGTLGAF